MNKLLILFIFSSFFLAASAQDVGGFWKGELSFVGGCFARNNIELQLKTVGDGVYGSSYHYLDTGNYIRKEASGYFDAKNRRLLIQEGAVTAQLLVDRCQICIKKFQFLYRKDGNKEFLDGFWTGKLQGTNLDCGTGGTITLSRTLDPTFKEEKMPEIKVDTGEIRLRFYDNATVDGDSITVLVDNKVVLFHQLLSDKPATAMVKISLENPMVVVEMIAENEGSIPPNTAFLEVLAGTVYHRLFLSSTLKKSAKVRFVYDKDAIKKPQVIGF
ncbi:MAG: hypothetical protein M3Y85_02310 [Bacteroidota bacterium]|nr:hypothetical protein [Bacteroidota bacterium]